MDPWLDWSSLPISNKGMVLFFVLQGAGAAVAKFPLFGSQLHGHISMGEFYSAVKTEKSNPTIAKKLN